MVSALQHKHSGFLHPDALLSSSNFVSIEENDFYQQSA